MSLDDDEDLKALRRAASRRMWTLRLAGLGVVVVFVGMIAWNFTAPMRHRAKNRMTDAEVAAFNEQMAAALKRVDDQEATWARQTALSTLETLETTDGECPLDLQPPTTTAIDSYLKSGSIDMNYIGNVSFTRVKPGESFGPCEECDLVRAAIRRGLRDADIGEKSRSSARWHESRFGSGASGWTIFVVADEWKDPVELGVGFEPGHVVGRAYVYGHQSRRWVCTTELDVESSPTVKGYFTQRYDGTDTRHQGMQKALDFDLQVQVKRAIARTSTFIAESGDDALEE